MDDFAYAITKGFTWYVNFKERSARYEFWYWTLFSFLVNLVAGLADGSLLSGGSGLASSIVSLGLLLPGLAVSVRRMHDIGRTGWWVLINFIPLLGQAIFIYFAVQPSEPHFNRFGENPFVRRAAEEDGTIGDDDDGEEDGIDEGRKARNIETHQSSE
ncbi:MAG: DUF805 domain-containing protein [Alphaproteobacteria bacterium]|nr:DUF805 domain-containing protein [Alphaproteobacteria bacterium]